MVNVTRIKFDNADKPDDPYNYNDETEFDTWDEEELAELWWEFCKENSLIRVDKERIEEE